MSEMSKVTKERLSSIERYAIYMAYGQKCNYCGKPILYENLEIDHIVPVSLKKDDQRLREIKKHCKLTDDFTIDSLLNLSPTCKKCNLEKGCDVNEDRIIHFCAKAKQKEKSLLEQINRANNLKSNEKSLLLLSPKLQSHQEIEDYAKRLHQLADIVKLETPLKFKDYPEKQAIDRKENLLDLELELQLEELTLTNDMGNIKKVKTCREWREAIENNYYALSTYDMKEESYFKIASQTIDMIQKAQTPLMSYIANPKVGVIDTEFLSLDFLPEKFYPCNICEEYEKDLLQNQGATNIKELVQLEKLKITNVTHNSINFEDNEGGGMYYKELLRADLNHDELEDILIFWYTYSLTGTLGFGDVSIISRKATDSLFEFLPTS